MVHRYINQRNMKCEVFMVMNISITLFWNVMLCNPVLGYQHFREIYWSSEASSQKVVILNERNAMKNLRQQNLIEAGKIW